MPVYLSATIMSSTDTAPTQDLNEGSRLHRVRVLAVAGLQLACQIDFVGVHNTCRCTSCQGRFLFVFAL